ncbi:MAG TPA: glycoside hydrolase family 15 protein [Actinomycetota bacterium]|nr:glycoside hydrolase family 15 protein [Actinomycetota bacterium]
MTGRQVAGATVERSRYPPISDYGFISDCHSVALVSRGGSIDWCCMPRVDAGSCFGRLLGWERGGHCSIAPIAEHSVSRRYLEGTLVLETTFRAGRGEARLLDCFTMREGGAEDPHRQLLRVVEGVRGRVELQIAVVPRFDYGEVRPWIRHLGVREYSAIGGSHGLLITSDVDVEPTGLHELGARLVLRAGQRVHLSIQHVEPERLDEGHPRPPDPSEQWRRLEETIGWWRAWSARGRVDGSDGPAALRSALVLKGLTHAPTGAIAAAPTTSLPEAPGASRNWDYRYTWVRDSSFTVRSLAELGYDAEADGFRRFIERSAAGSADELQIAYGVGGERRLTELSLRTLEGYRGARPVRIGNAAVGQVQLDVYGELLDLAWRWHRRGRSPDDDYWRFLVELVNAAAERWQEPDRGLWEVRGRPQHFVHSKVMCWAALDRGIGLAKESSRRAPVRRWGQVRDEIRRAIESRGYERKRAVFVRAFGSTGLDGALLLLPIVGFVAWDDERFVRTVDAIREDLDEGGLLVRYRRADGLRGREGVFLACSFWLAECLARQGRLAEAREVFDRVASTANDLGLFSEEYDPARGEMLGNFPQGLTHLSHIAAAVALAAQPAAG